MFGFVSRKKYQAALDEIKRLDARVEAATARRFEAIDSADYFASTLHTLRRNCFITNARGHRVKYLNATVEERLKAEGVKP